VILFYDSFSSDSGDFRLASVRVGSQSYTSVRKSKFRVRVSVSGTRTSVVWSARFRQVQVRFSCELCVLGLGFAGVKPGHVWSGKESSSCHRLITVRSVVRRHVLTNLPFFLFMVGSGKNTFACFPQWFGKFVSRSVGAVPAGTALRFLLGMSRCRSLRFGPVRNG